MTVQGESDSEPETAPPGIYAPSDNFRFYPQMIRWVANEINRLVQEEGTPPGEIVVMAPFVSDALRFSLQHALSLHNIEVATHRPSRALEAEPAARTLLALAKLAHPHWRLEPAAPDVAHMLAVSIPRLDPLRANVLADIVYQPRRRGFELSAFAALADPARTRITYAAGEEYDQLRSWLAGYRASGEDAPLDQFFARVFGELLSQPGYGFHADRDAARVASQLVESARKFRWALEDVAEYLPEQGPSPGDQPLLQKPTTKEIGREYLRLAESGALSALYVPGWRVPEDAVFLAPAYTFLLRNRAVDVQFWLDIGANGWWERLYQPLTHPYVLSPHWPETDQWTDKNEYETSQDTLRRLLLGLFRRTRREIYVAVSEFSESGSEQHGRLLSIVNRLLAER
ncbi:MAG: hypothetical protein IPK16_01255 [Anaerolineales bacterium]|nr:hypothetical protein [Anaerolineales bacterium]